MISKAILDKVKPFTQLGVDFTETHDREVLGTCPFTDDERKFFVNYTNLLWDAKSAVLDGDLAGFLSAICEYNEERINQTVKMIELARHRKLPTEAFEGYTIGWDGEKYTIPIRDARGKVTDVRRVFLKKKKLSMYGITGGKVGIFNGDALSDNQLKDEPVYICEGEWDAIALNWLLRKNKAPGFAVGMPGAGTFKVVWAELFRKRDVTVCYDNDVAGAEGEEKVMRRLDNVCKSIAFIRWPDELPADFDVRDWVSNGHKRRIPEKSLTKFLALQTGMPRITPEQQPADVEPPRRRKTITTRAKHEDLYKAFCEELEVSSEDTLAVVMATILANRLPGDPLWVLIVAKSGAGKTEYLSTMDGYDECVFTAEFTPHTLVSGMPTSNGRDPSLLPKLDGKVLVIKDFTVILSMHPTGRDEIFGQLREAYDGTYKKQFGNGLTRDYESSFGLIAAVTNRIDEFGSLHAGLGERFVKYRMPNPKVKMEQDIIMSAIMKAGKEDGMRERLQQCVTEFLDNTPDDEPKVDRATAKTITAIAVVISRLRGYVSLNEYTGVQHSKATFEMGTRLAKQLVRLWKGLVMYFGNRTEALRIVRHVARGSVVDKRDEVVKVLARLSAEEPDQRTGRAIAEKCQGISGSTVTRELDDLSLLGIVSSSPLKSKTKTNAKTRSFTNSFNTLLVASSLYAGAD